MDTSPELVNPTGKFKIGSVEAELALNYAGAGAGGGQPDLTLHLPANYWDLSQTNKLRPAPHWLVVVLVFQIFFAYF